MDTNTNPNFAATQIFIQLDDGMRPNRQVFIPSLDAIRWDGAQADTNCAIESVFNHVLCYAEMKITGRKLRIFPGGMFGLKARVRFTGEDSSGEWHDAVIAR